MYETSDPKEAALQWKVLQWNAVYNFGAFVIDGMWDSLMQTFTLSFQFYFLSYAAFFSDFLMHQGQKSKWYIVLKMTVQLEI